MNADLSTRPLMSRLYQAVALGEDRVQIANRHRTFVISGPGYGRQLPAMLHALDGLTTVAEIQERFPGLIPVLEALVSQGLVLDMGPAGLADRGVGGAVATSALEAWTSPLRPRPALGRATVGFVGCGPVAGTAAVALAKAGIGSILLYDDQRVSAEEITVSPLLGTSAEGLRRSEAVAERCEMGSTAGLGALEQPSLPTLLGESDLVVIEARHQAGVRSAGELATAGCVPYLIHGQDALEATVGPFVPARQRPSSVREGAEVVELPSPCHMCVEIRQLSHEPHLDEERAYVDHRTRHSPEPDSYLAPHTAFVAGLLATEVLRVLLGERCSALGAVLVIDLVTMEVVREGILAVPGCPNCTRERHEEAAS